MPGATKRRQFNENFDVEPVWPPAISAVAVFVGGVAPQTGRRPTVSSDVYFAACGAGRVPVEG